MSFQPHRPYLQVQTATHLKLTKGVLYTGARGDTWHIHMGFRTDLASIPRVFRWLVSEYGAHVLAALLHDYLRWLIREAAREAQVPTSTEPIGQPIPTLAEADGLFRRVLLEEGTSWFLAQLMWAAVRTESRMAGATRRDWLRYLACLPFGLLVAVLSLGPLVGRALLRTAEWVERRLG